MKFLPARVDVERRADGTLVLRSPEPLEPFRRCIGEYLEEWADRTPDAVFLAQRDGDGWRKLTFSETRSRVRAIASFFLRSNFASNRPIAILSDNSIEQALITLAAMHIGIPAAPLSPAYSLLSKDFAKLRSIFALIQPQAVFVNDAARFANALDAVSCHDLHLIAGRGDVEKISEREDSAAVDRAFAAIGPDTVGKLLLTSGSTGQPKAVINTQRMMCSNQQSFAQAWPFVKEEAPVLVEWLPWNHTFGGNNNFHLCLANGGSMYVDEGKPAPGLIETSVRNLREVAPTIHFNVPRAYDLLIPYLERDDVFRRAFFSRVKVVMYAAAALPGHLWERLNRLAIAERGEPVPIVSGWGSTETAPLATIVHFEPVRCSVIGLPAPGIELKMVPVSEDGKYELRVRGPNVTPGYLARPDLTAAAFDDEGFYKMGDAGVLADVYDAAKGIEFAGRLAEDFKLSSGTWVRVGALRVAAIEALSPVAQDVVVAGHDRDQVGLLIFPSPAVRDKVHEPTIKAQVREGLQRLKQISTCATMLANRAMMLREPPSIDAGEITDKGYINQRAVLERRAALVEVLYANNPPEDVIQL